MYRQGYTCFMTKSKYFSETNCRDRGRLVMVPSADIPGVLYYRLRTPSVRLIYIRNRGEISKLLINSSALRSYYAQRRKKRKPVTYEMKWELAARQRWKCKTCKKLLPLAAQADHVVPLCLGGADEMKNLQMLCANCHAEKSRKEAKQSIEKGRGLKGYFYSKQ